jgi:hypothetical protein
VDKAGKPQTFNEAMDALMFQITDVDKEKLNG